MTHQAQGGQPPIEYFYMYEIFIPEMRLAVARFSSFVSSFFFLFYFFSSSRVLGEIRREKRYELAPLDAFIVGWGPDYARKLKPSSIYASIVETLRPFRVTLYVCCFFFFFVSFYLLDDGIARGVSRQREFLAMEYVFEYL